MIKPFPLHKLVHEHDFVPQALIAFPVWELAKRFGAEIEKGDDDLDYYIGAGAILDDEIPFTVMYYMGHPENTSTIYLPFELKNVEYITKIIGSIAMELKLPKTSIKWQRKDGVKFWGA
jgi:hypothetical protein